jgi:hypothetical protein
MIYEGLGKLVLQSVLFDKNKFDTTTARHFLKVSKIKRLKKVDITDRFYRYRIRDPEEFDKESFRIIKISDHIKYIMGNLK